MAEMRYDDCPRFDKCSAPICPLDPKWRERAHLSEDRLCFYLCESVKPGGMNRIPSQLYECAVRLASDERLPGVIKRKLRVSAATSSRIEAGRRLALNTLGVDTGKRSEEIFEMNFQPMKSG